jgi:DNA invertase Pin-like site-specific DNA recombinase
VTHSIKTALYARVSTADQDCTVQLRELREYSERRGFTIAEEYVDQGVSGTRASRPALDRLMRDAAERRFDAVIVWKIDRFGRSVLHLSQQLAALDSYGVRFIATSQALDTDHRNPTSRLLLQILSSVAEFERELIAERTRAAGCGGAGKRQTRRATEARLPARRSRPAHGDRTRMSLPQRATLISRFPAMARC